MQETVNESERKAHGCEDRYQRERSRQEDSLRLCRVELSEMERELSLLSSANNNDSPVQTRPRGGSIDVRALVTRDTGTGPLSDDSENLSGYGLLFGVITVAYYRLVAVAKMLKSIFICLQSCNFMCLYV